MSFPRYPKYKQSGEEWLGEVPEEWEVKPLRSVFKFSKGLTITKEDLRDEGVCCVNYGEIHSKYGFRLNPEIHPLRCVDSEYRSSNPEALIRDGDFVFADTSEDLEGSGNFTHLQSEDPIFAGYHTIIGRPRKDISSLLLAYQIHSSAFRSQIQRQVKGVKVFSISQSILKAAKCLLPPLPEQTAIAEFLDRETGKIDELVAEQRRLMELLKEKRQAVISHAVTKGLNPLAPMKPSGIEWLGDVPEHWKVIPIKLLSPVKRGASPRPIDDPKYFDEEGEYAWVRIADVSACDGVLSETTQRLSPLGSSLSVKILPNELFVSIAGTVGKPCISAIKACIHDGFVYFPTLKINPWFLFRIFEAGDCYGGLGKWGTQLNLNTDTVGSIRIAIPPADELHQILKFMDDESSRFDTLTAEAQRTIVLLQERRTALISAAVTGQIDVRQPPKN